MGMGVGVGACVCLCVSVSVSEDVRVSLEGTSARSVVPSFRPSLSPSASRPPYAFPFSPLFRNGWMPYRRARERAGTHSASLCAHFLHCLHALPSLISFFPRRLTEKTWEEKHKQNERAFELFEKKNKHLDELNAVGGLSLRDDNVAAPAASASAEV